MNLGLMKENQRVDGRDIEEYRNISIRFPKDPKTPYKSGFCLVGFGKTSAYARISCDVVEPKKDHPSRGLIKLNIDTNFVKSSSNKLRSPTEQILKLEPVIKDVIRSAIDLDALCICSGERVFRINIDIKAQCDDGNLLDVITFAAYVALKTFKRPDVTVGDSGNIIVEDIEKREPVPLQMKEIPIFVTVGALLESNMLIFDLNRQEEEAVDGRFVVSMTLSGRLGSMYPLGSKMWTYDDVVMRCINLVKSKVEGLKGLIDIALRVYKSSQGSIVINSTSFLPNHPVFTNDSVNDKTMETEMQIGNAPECLSGSDDMDLGSEEETQVDDWNRIDSLMAHTENIVSQQNYK